LASGSAAILLRISFSTTECRCSAGSRVAQELVVNGRRA
jgi:hypothetical protein